MAKNKHRKSTPLVEAESAAIKERVVAVMNEVDFEDLQFIDNIVGSVEGYRLFFHVLNSNKL